MKKFFLIGIIVTLLIAVPLTVYILTTQKTNTQSGAAPSTVLSFDIPQDPAEVGTPISIPVDVDPTGGGSTGNQVAFIKVVITYDGSKLQAANTYFTPDPKFSTVLEGPSNSCDGTKCTISATLSTGSDPNNAVSSQNPVGTLIFNPLAATDTNSPTQLAFGPGNQVLSIAATDKPAENVLNRAQPGSLTIIASTVTPTQGDNGGGGDNDGGGDNGGGDNGGGSNGGGGDTGGTGGTTGPLTCNSLSADNTTADTAPFTALFTVTGGSTAGNITDVSFNFGDGSVQDIASGSAIGTSSISVQQSHIYKTTGTFTATAVLTDDQGNTTTPSDCSQTITVGATSTDTTTPTTIAEASATPTIPPTGPGNVILGIGAAGLVITVVGLLVAIGL